MADSAANSYGLRLRRQTAYRGIRVLVWDGDILYGCRGYEVVRLPAGASNWDSVAEFHPIWWRSITSRMNLTYRLVRDGFHALTVLSDGTMVGAVPGAIVTRRPWEEIFRTTHRILRGTRPLHITTTPSGRTYWGEYFDNRQRADVHICASEDQGETWEVAYTFPAGSVRHVHNIVYDRWGACLWILTGDDGAECQVLHASLDLRSVETVLAGNQQARAVAAIPTKDALYLSTDTPYERNHVYRLERSGRLERVGDLNSSSIYGCRVGDALFFSTMVEPSAVNVDSEVHIAGSREGISWHTLSRWKKDRFPLRYFQYGNAILPDGENTTRILAATTVAVEQDDLTTILWEVG
ncbi:MAG TPA: hypothetical protein VNW47_10870 [Terriglobales bacterium]|jgi:hypothetical protein|nr:hypothetical protein [Terriglobales bacterium]